MTKRNYPLIDLFRIIAAFLVVAIHTSPLLIFGETADFVLTRIIARVAVPFFFMTSGFFLIEQYQSRQKIAEFIKRTAIIYFAAIALYVPFNIYGGYFVRDNLLPSIIKDIVFDGTFYHLWYLAAAITGALISWLLVSRLGFKKAFAIAAILYLIGLLGDSYYGLVQSLPFFENFYGSIFQISEYTRNGIFFAPIFFVLGGIIKSQNFCFSVKGNITGLAVSFALMVSEGMILHLNKLQRHDSMYLALVPLMFFLFSLLAEFKGRRFTALKSAALTIYIIHPLMIILIRGFAKITGLQRLLIDNSLVHFIAVCIASTAAAVCINLIWTRLKPKQPQAFDKTNRAWITVNLKNLKHNARLLQEAMPSSCKLMAVVKAEGYGHGAAEISKILNSEGVTAFAVATVDEGIKLRQAGIKGEILILGYTSPERARQLQKYDLVQTLIDYEYALSLNSMGCNIKAHIKVDTGMHRLGFEVKDYNKIKNMFSARHIKICGIYTHLAASQSLLPQDISFTNSQIEAFYKLLDTLSLDGISVPSVHIQSSFGLLNYPKLNCNYARIGLALYGGINCEETKLKLDLRPVLALKAKVALIREIKKDDIAGYDRKFTAQTDSRIAVLSIGYADGIPRCLSCGGSVLIRGMRAPIIGQICMDQLMVDITHVHGAKTGDTATIIGKDGDDEIFAAELAAQASSIPNELLSRMGNRLDVIFN